MGARFLFTDVATSMSFMHRPLKFRLLDQKHPLFQLCLQQQRESQSPRRRIGQGPYEELRRDQRRPLPTQVRILAGKLTLGLLLRQRQGTNLLLESPSKTCRKETIRLNGMVLAIAHQRKTLTLPLRSAKWVLLTHTLILSFRLRR